MTCPSKVLIECLGSQADILELLARLSNDENTVLEDNIQRNIFLKKQAVQAIADFTVKETDAVLAKTFVVATAGKPHPIATLHELLLSAIEMNGELVALS